MEEVMKLEVGAGMGADALLVVVSVLNSRVFGTMCAHFTCTVSWHYQFTR